MTALAFVLFHHHAELRHLWACVPSRYGGRGACFSWWQVGW